MAVTLSDVAKRARVSLGVASDVINNRRRSIRVGNATRERILSAVADLEYHPNAFARSLRTRRSYMIGVILSDITDPYYGDILRGIESSCVSHEYHYLLSGTEGEGEEKQPCWEMHKQRGVDGILSIGMNPKVDENALIKLAKENFPVVLLNRTVDFYDAPCILVDNVKGGCLVVEHLIELGHKRIGCMRGEPDRFDSIERCRGYRETLEGHGLTYQERFIVQGEHTLRGGYKAMKELLCRGEVISAVFAFNDMSAIGAMKACKENGLRIPDDMSIVGFDDIAVAEYYDPPLTTIRQPTFEMGKKAVDSLIEIIEGRQEEAPAGVNRKILFEPELVVRGSTGECRE